MPLPRTHAHLLLLLLAVAVKKKLTRNELIENHSEKTQTIKDFKDKLDKSNRILDELKTDYTEIKCRCCLTRGRSDGARRGGGMQGTAASGGGRLGDGRTQTASDVI